MEARAFDRPFCRGLLLLTPVCPGPLSFALALPSPPLQATIIIFLITLAVLVVLGCIRNRVPKLAHWIAAGNTAGH
jgi:hypothetical protein